MSGLRAGATPRRRRLSRPGPVLPWPHSMEQTSLTPKAVRARPRRRPGRRLGVRRARVAARQKRNGEPFLKLQLGDVSGSHRGGHAGTASRTPEAGCVPGAVVRVAGRYQRRRALRRQASRSARCAPAAEGEYDPADLHRGARRSRIEQMAADLEELIGTVQRPHLRELLDRLLGAGAPRSASAGTRRPAAKYYHQAYRHGLLEHSLSVAQGVSAMAATFPGHRPRRGGDRRAAARHRQGRGIRADRRGHRAHRRRQAARRDPARLLPRPPRDRGDRRASRPTTAQAVLHIILSHHGKLEHGSPVVPCTREATLVHMIDNLGGNARQLRPDREEPRRRRALVGDSTGASRHRPTSGPRAETAAKPLRRAGLPGREAANSRVAGVRTAVSRLSSDASWPRTPKSSSGSCR